jgi:hypothetical protein
MAGHEPVQLVDDPRCACRSQQGGQRAGEAELGEKRDAPSAVARDGRAIAKDEPPAFGPFRLGHGGEQRVGLLICEREQGHLPLPVELGDDPRRPAAEPSAAGVEKDWARQSGAHTRRSVHVLSHGHPRRRPRMIR